MEKIKTELKQQRYAALKQESMALKEWFLRNANAYITSVQSGLFSAVPGEAIR